ncbi:MAG TPA: hypothetical protein P5136_00770 [Methanofastidiosum sp.]|nr:hypothetical protein [Methanofastidiosum sp.]
MSFFFKTKPSSEPAPKLFSEENTKAINKLNQLNQYWPGDPSLEGYMFTSAGLEPYSKKREEELDTWAVEQAKQTKIEIAPKREHPTITCGGCGAPVSKGFKCEYCGRIYNPVLVKNEENKNIISFDEIKEKLRKADRMYEDEKRKESYKQFWEQAYKRRGL